VGARWDVFKKAIGTWRLFKEIEPGHRFQTRYHSHRCRREQGETSQYGWIVNLIGGPALIAAGFVFLPTPGPSFIIVIGMWMLAGEFIPLARFFDRLDVRLRKMTRWIKECWSSLPSSVKVLATLLCVAALGYGIYCLLSSA
jgi:hypothetical protein